MDFFLFPYINFRRHKISESAFGNFYKRPVVHLVKSQSNGKSADRRRQHNGDVKRQRDIKQKNDTRSAGKINKLLKSKRSENFAFNLYKLRDLETHSLGIGAGLQPPVKLLYPLSSLMAIPPVLYTGQCLDICFASARRFGFCLFCPPVFPCKPSLPFPA